MTVNARHRSRRAPADRSAGDRTARLGPARTAAPAGAGEAAAQPLVDESVIHDLLNPMTAILGNLQLLQDFMGDDLEEKYGGRLAACLGSAEELSGMLVDLRRLMQMEEGDLRVDARPIRIPELLGHVRDVQARRAEQDDRRIVIEPVDRRLEVLGCGALLERAAHVLLLSALRAGGASPVVMRAERTAEGRVRLRFRYSGKPLPEPVAGRMFTRNSGRAQREHGTRLDRARGLVLARAIAEAHGGKVFYEPMVDGGCFCLDLPVEAP